MTQNNDIFMSMLKNKEEVLVSIIKDLDTCDKNMQAFEKLCSLFEQGKEVNTDKALTACAKSMRHMNDVNRRMLMVLMVYVSGNNYDGDTASVLVRMGRGQDAVREMFRRKMGRG